MIIAVDGPTASGKGTIARALAAHFGLPHLDTAVGWQVAARGGDPDLVDDALAATGFPDHLLADPALRSESTGALASRVSVHPAVREALLARQRAFAGQPGGAVLDGRDIATVIAPHADAKLYVTASVAARALRRTLEMRQRGEDVSRQSVGADLAARDARDSNRAIAPLRMAAGAVLLDTSALPPAAAIAAAIALVQKQTAKNKHCDD